MSLRNLLIGALSIGLFIGFSNYWVLSKSSGLSFSNVDEIPAKQVALVLGTSRSMRSGNMNLYFKYRLEAAHSLYKAGKVKHFLLSGDNHTFSYDEPQDMKDYLMALGVPEHCITLDYAGFRTFDSVVRAKKIFGQSELIIVSQPAHNKRALFLCKTHGIDAVAYDSKNPYISKKQSVREFFARTRAFLDVYILGTKPKFLGEEEFICLNEK